MHDGQDLADGNEPLLVDRFVDGNNFSAALGEVGIAGVVQDDDGKDNDNDNDNYDINTDEYQDEPPGISLEPAASCGEISGVHPP